MATQALIQLRDLSFGYLNQQLLLDNINLCLYPQERVALLGAIGSGKSTLLQLIVGLLPPTSGEIIIFNQRRQQQKDFLPLRGPIGLMFQDAEDQLFCPTVADDVAFGPLNQGKSLAEVETIVADTLTLLGLNDYSSRITYHLSGGEKRLVALAAVLAMQPHILLLDEPTTGLDESTQNRLIALLLELPQTMLIVSHQRDFLAQVSQRHVQLRKGQLW